MSDVKKWLANLLSKSPELKEEICGTKSKRKKLTRAVPFTNTKFYRTNESSVGTSRIGTLKTSYKKLHTLFGEPGYSDGEKVSMQWKLKDPVSGRVVTVYDYKMTSLYDPDLPSPDALKKRKSVEWSIGGSREEDAKRLIAYVKGRK